MNVIKVIGKYIAKCVLLYRPAVSGVSSTVYIDNVKYGVVYRPTF